MGDADQATMPADPLHEARSILRELVRHTNYHCTFNRPNFLIVRTVPGSIPAPTHEANIQVGAAAHAGSRVPAKLFFWRRHRYRSGIRSTVRVYPSVSQGSARTRLGQGTWRR